jgi:unsaturated chondroitin disaccharide hydrolase
LVVPAMLWGCGGGESASAPLPAGNSDALDIAVAVYLPLAQQLDPNRGYPRSLSSGRTWRQVSPSDWTSGFFPGILWQLYEHQPSPDLLSQARRWTAGLAGQERADLHDLGFMIGNSFGHAYRLTGEPTFRPILVQAARSVGARFSPEVGAIRSWDFGEYTFPVIIDSLMNLELLFQVAGMENDESLRALALRHADRVLAEHLRPDGSSFHIVDFDPADGAVRTRGTVQGYSHQSTWARGQAWGIYGFTMVYRETGELRFMAAAIAMADFFLGRLPPDGVPYWDLDFEAGSLEPRDTSASAIAASALWELSQLVPESESAQRYRDASIAIVKALKSGTYWVGSSGTAALLGKATGNRPSDREVEVSLIYADYYFIEAASRQAR